MKIGLQLFTLRDELAQDFKGTLRQVAAMGYEGVEFAGYGDIPAEELKALLDELGMEGFGSHIGLQQLEANIEGEIAYLKTIGARYAILPWVSPEMVAGGEAFWRDLITKLEQFGKKFHEAGLEFCYHNHDFEFALQIDGEFVFDAMYTKVAADLLKVEMDIGWVQYSNQDPIAYIAKYAGRLPLLHLKDFRKGNPGEQIDTVELGNGDLALNDIIAAADKASVEWIVVEQDRCANPPLESVQTSINWLRENGHKA
ncbi:sugar phosphate isomerase/epimerase family protein [Paenibacillus albus]|uniref:sugar phosphate isomerase/epimerase family protein n=1 Tax=Paenibacillus albus TaxID=2495582 RepID=UPI0026B35ED7|nr:sugar phosphate isomerase/epimerase [Paenibacillus albus]